MRSRSAVPVGDEPPAEYDARLGHDVADVVTDQGLCASRRDSIARLACLPSSSCGMPCWSSTALSGDLVAQRRREGVAWSSREVDENDRRVTDRDLGQIIELLRRGAVVPLRAEPDRDRVGVRRCGAVGVEARASGRPSPCPAGPTTAEPSRLLRAAGVALGADLAVGELRGVPAEGLVPGASSGGLESVLVAVLLEDTLLRRGCSRTAGLPGAKPVAVVGKILDQQVDEVV